MTPILNIVVALHCEAKPIINRFYLKKRLEKSPFSIFSNQHKTLNLIVSGVGKIKMASATTYIYERQNHAAFLNIGIAGAANYAVGEAVLVNKIIENSTQRCWYPYVSPLKYPRQTTLETYDLPQKQYPLQGMIDMEGSAFFQTAAQFVTQEHIQMLKIISDNSMVTQKQINEQYVQALVADKLTDIEFLVQYLLNLSARESLKENHLEWVPDFQMQWHFTHSQLIQLKEYLRRWQIKLADQHPVLFCREEKNAESVIKKMKHQLELSS